MISEITFTQLRKASELLAQLSAEQKNHALQTISDHFKKNKQAILSANNQDIEHAKRNGMSESLLDRLRLTEQRIITMAENILVIIAQTDPIGQIINGWNTPTGIEIKSIRVPLGVAAIIYESRPNVTVDAFALAWKSGNAILLRGSSSAIHSNRIIVQIIQQALQSVQNDYKYAIALADGNRDEVTQILQAKGLIDVVLPRGGAALIKMVVENARIPVIETGSGVCHLFVDESAQLTMAANIAENGKLQRPGVCNALETILIHEKIASDFIPLLIQTFNARCEIRACKKSFAIAQNIVQQTANEHIKNTLIKPAQPSDFGKEFLDYIIAIKIVSNIHEAILHINTHNTKHSESIITQDRTNARLFQHNVDAAAVYVNASTRFTDGEVFGFGAEFGISTQKMHVRGPMGLTALTSIKYCIDGNGNIR